MFKKISFCIILLLILVNTCFLGIAEEINTPGISTPTPNINEEMKKEIGRLAKSVDVIDNISNVFNSIKDGVSNVFGGIKTFFEDGVGGVIEKSLGEIFESFVNATAIDGKWVFSTPTLVEFDWVKNIWWIMFFISIGSIGIGMGVTMLRILAGKYKGNLRTTLLSFLLSSIMLMFSLFIADKMILFGNDLMNSFSRSALTTEIQKPENQSELLIGEIDYSKIGFHYLDGKSLVNLSFGVKLADLGEDKDEWHMYDQFLSKNGGGGALILVWAMLVIGFIGIFGTLRQFVIGLINGLGPMWISIAAWTGNMKPIYGYLNLNIRCIALSFVFDLTWLICMYVTNHSGDFAVGRQLAATLLYTIALVFSCYLFGYWVYQAFKSPIDLAGGLMQEKVMKMFTRVHPAAGAASKALGVSQETPIDSDSSSDYNSNDSKYDRTEDFAKTEIKDRLTAAEQIVKPSIPLNTGNIQVKSYDPSNNTRYDSTLERPVKSASSLSEAELYPKQKSSEQFPNGKLLITEHHYLHNSHSSPEEKTEDYHRTQKVFDDLNRKPNTNENSNQVRNALKQAEDIKPGKNGGRLLDTIKNNKKDGEKS